MGRKKKEPPSKARPAPRRRRHGRVGLGMVMTLTFAGLLFLLLFLSLSGRTVVIPETLRAAVEERINGDLEGAPLSLGGMRFGVGRDGIPLIFLDDVRFADLAGGAVAELNRIGASLSPSRLLRGQIAASNLALAGAQITVRRAVDGSFAFQSQQLAEGESQSLPDLLARVDQVLETGALASLEEVHAAGVVISLEDARSGRIWQATNANAVLRKTADGLTVSVTSDVFNGTDDIAAVQLSLSHSRTTGHATLGFAMKDMPAADMALQSPVLSFLGVLDAPISGSVRTELDETGNLASFAGTLDIAAGALQPAENIPRAEFDKAKAYLTYDANQRRIDFTELSITSDQLNLVATGKSYLSELDGPWPRAFLGQFRVDKLDYGGEGVLQGAVSLNDIRADLRLRLDPFVVELGQVAVNDPEGLVTASGRIEAADGGWHVAVDAQADQVSSERVMAFWPLRVSPITRGWLSRNLREGVVRNPAFAVRFHTGEKPDASMSFLFDGGVARLLPDMPLLTDASGRATMGDHRFMLTLLNGEVDSGAGGQVDLSGSVFAVPDVRPRPAEAVIDIAATGTLTDTLSILNNPPLRIMDRAKRPVDIAEAKSDVRATVRLPLKKKLDGHEVAYDVTADLTDVSTSNLVQGREFTARSLALVADNTLVGLDGEATLDGVPLSASWRQPLGEKAKQGGVVTGTVSLSQAAMEAFDIPLPDGMISGTGRSSYSLVLPTDAPPRLFLSSSLSGLDLNLSSVGWTKPAREQGALRVEATLGAVPRVDLLELESAGLGLEGDISLTESGFSQAEFSRVRIGEWLDAPVTLTSRGSDEPPSIALTGGQFDLRKYDPASSGGSRDGAGIGRGGSPIDIQLDRLIVSDSLALVPVTGRLEPTSLGLAGDFRGRVNGNTPILGSLAPANAGTAIRIQSADAAGVLRDAGLTPNANDGDLDLVLTPVSGSPGTYNGEFLIQDFRLRKAPLMADLLDAISVVGLLNQLEGPGIKFASLDGKFRLTRQRLTLIEAAAVGGSLGISADGIYDFGTKTMDFRGVISPVYFLNGVGSILTRRGEGLFGFNYRMTGAVDDPEVRVNPLSIFTPGAFRQIFRRSPPGSE